MLPHVSTTKSIRNKSLRQHSHLLFFKKFQRFREQIVETAGEVPQERVTQRTSEQFEVQMHTSSTSTSKQTVDIPIPRGVEEVGDTSVRLGTHAINE